MKTKYVRMHLRGSMTLVDDTFQQTTIQVPIDADRNVGVAIRNINVEMKPLGAMLAALDSREVQLTNKSQSAIVNIDDSSCMWKGGDSQIGELTANYGHNIDNFIRSGELKPPIPVFNQEIYIGAHCDGAGAVVVAWDIIYDVATYDEGEMMSLMKQYLL